MHGILFVSLAARFRSPTRSTTLVDGLTKFRAAHNSDRVTLHALSTAWEESVLHRSVAFSKMEAHNFVSTAPSPTPSLFYLHNAKGSCNPTLHNGINTWLLTTHCEASDKDSWPDQQTSYRANRCRHPQWMSCHSLWIDCWYYSDYVPWCVYLETFPQWKWKMEMDSHGGLEVTIRQTESKKNYPTT